MKAEQLLPDAANAVERDGITVRKGSVGAFLVNAKLMADPETPPELRATAQADLVELVPALRALGLFEVFELRDPALREQVEAVP